MRSAGQSAAVMTVEVSAETHAETWKLSSVTANPYSDFEAFLGEVRRLGATFLPRSVISALDTLKRHGGSPAVLIKGLPLPDNIPPTPDSPFTQSDGSAIGTEALLVAIASQLGEPFSYHQWDSGHLVHNKYPIKEHRAVQFGSNAVEFLLHTETPFRDVSPDFLVLFCIRSDPTRKAKTRVADIADAAARLPADLRRALREPWYAFETDNPVHVVNGRGITEPRPVITDRDGREVLEYVGDLVSITQHGEDALTELGRRLAEAAMDVPLSAGQMLVLDNLRAVHGRNAFEPRYDGSDRWLQRVLLTNRLLPAGAQGQDRLITDRRYANYPGSYQRVLSGN